MRDNGNWSNQESKFDFLATRQSQMKIYEGQQKMKHASNREEQPAPSLHIPPGELGDDVWVEDPESVNGPCYMCGRASASGEKESKI